MFDPEQTGNFMGGHAVVIIGWGIEKGMTVPFTNRVVDVPYWYCRNSWGEKWGSDGGYFKIAMYPFNKSSQFDKLVSFQLPSGGTSSVGGFILFKPTLFKPNEFSKLAEAKLSKDRTFYTEDGAVGADRSSTSIVPEKIVLYKREDGTPVEVNKNTFYGIIAGVVGLTLAGVGYYYRKDIEEYLKKKQKKARKNKK
jgi:hypothetical protein